MIFKISGKFKWCQVFDGRLNNITNCELELGSEYSLIYANLTEAEDGRSLDIFGLLNSTFGVSLPPGFLLVSQAGFFTYNDRSDQGNSTSLIEVFPDLPIADSVMDRAFPVKNTASFWCAFQIGQNSLFKSLIEISSDEVKGNQPLSLMGTFASGKQAGNQITETQYTALLPDFKLFSLFWFQDLTLAFSFGENTHYEIKGLLKVDLFDLLFEFQGRAKSTDAAFTACIGISVTSQNNQVEDPFGGMMGVTFTDLKFAILYNYAKKPQKKGNGHYRVLGEISYAGTTLVGQIYLKNTTPILASVVVKEGLDMGEIFNQSLPSGINWPSDFINITFEPGSRLYYLKEGETAPIEDSFARDEDVPQETIIDPEALHYAEGFNLYAYFTITLIKSISLAGNMTISSKGVTATIQMEDIIDIFVLQLTAPEPSEGGAIVTPGLAGPIFCFSSEKNLLGFEAGINFFQKDFGLDVVVEGSKERKGKNNQLAIKGRLTSTQAYAPMLPANSSMGFEYSESKGFAITDWPDFDMPNHDFDFVEILQDIAASVTGNICGKIADFISAELLSSEFYITPSMESEGDELKFTLNGYYTMSLAAGGVDEEFLSLEFPNAVVITIPDDLSMDDFPGAISDAFADAAVSFVEGLLANTKAIALFLTVVAGEKAVGYAATLACKRLAKKEIVEATEAGSAAFSGPGATTFSLGIGLAIIAIAGSIDSCFTKGTLVLLADGSYEPIEDIKVGDSVLGAGTSHNRVTRVECVQLGTRHLYAFNKDRFFVTAEHPFMTQDGWKSIEPAATFKENSALTVKALAVGDQLINEAGKSISLQSIDSMASETTMTVYNLLLEDGHTYFADGYLVHNKGGGGDDPDDTDLKPPQTLSLAFAAGQLTVTWTATALAQQYIIKMAKPGAETKISKTVPSDQLSVDFSITEQDPSGLYTLGVASNSYDLQQTTAFTTATITRLEAPEISIKLGPDFQEEDVPAQASWPAVEGTKTYIFNNNGQVQTYPENEPPEDEPPVVLQIPFTQDDSAGDYSYAATALGDGSVIDSIASPTKTWHRIARPVITSVTSDGIRLVIGWNSVEDTRDYLVVVKDSHNNTLTSVSSQSNSISLAWAAHSFPPDALVYVRAIPQASEAIPSRWSEPGSVVLSTSAAQIAAQCYLAEESGPACAQKIISSFPTLSPTEMAVAMKSGGYFYAATEQGLIAAYPNKTHADLERALAAAFGPVPASEGQATAQSIAAYVDILGLLGAQDFDGGGTLEQTIKGFYYGLDLSASYKAFVQLAMAEPLQAWSTTEQRYLFSAVWGNVISSAGGRYPRLTDASGVGDRFNDYVRLCGNNGDTQGLKLKVSESDIHRNRDGVEYLKSAYQLRIPARRGQWLRWCANSTTAYSGAQWVIERISVLNATPGRILLVGEQQTSTVYSIPISRPESANFNTQTVSALNLLAQVTTDQTLRVGDKITYNIVFKLITAQGDVFAAFDVKAEIVITE